MDKFKEDQLAMCERLVGYLGEHEGAIGVSAAAGEQADEVRDLYGQLEGSREGTAKRTEPLTQEAREARKLLLELLPALLGPMTRVAQRLADHDLLAAVTLSSKQLRRLRPLAFIGVAEAVLGSAARADVVPELTRQGLTAAALQPLRAALTTYKAAQPAPRKAINERVLAGAELEDLVDALMDEVRALDQDMKAFKLLNRPLHRGYLQVRKILNSGGNTGGVKP
ncbi:hypothetical protein [Hymenobacter sp. B81]|uniref:hypothetical protein n=1 Tax=Hymenobacter sp. B81 TaxID=3344878 RepID=UPI0037DD8685